MVVVQLDPVFSILNMNKIMEGQAQLLMKLLGSLQKVNNMWLKIKTIVRRKIKFGQK